MSHFNFRVEQCIESLEFVSKKALEIIKLVIGADEEYNKFSDAQKTKDFGELGCDIMQQANMAVLAIDTPEEFYNDLMSVGKDTIKTVHDALNNYILQGESLCKEPEYPTSDSDLRAKLDIAISIRNLFRKS